MLVACWSSKGGAGTTVVAAGLAVLLSRRNRAGALVVDLAGDVPAALGLPEPAGPGVADWLRVGDDVPADALGRLEQPAGDRLAVLTRGHGHLGEARGEVLAALLASDPRPVVADCGTGPSGVALVVAAGATRSILVTRPCFLSLRRAAAVPLRPSEVVLLAEPGRALTRADVEDCIGAPVVAEVPVDPQVARAVDAGLLATRLPRTLVREAAVLPEAHRHDLVGTVHARLVDGDPAGVSDLERVRAEVRRAEPLLADADVLAVAQAVAARATGLGRLEPLLADETISEVMVNGRGPVWIERAGRLLPTDVHLARPEVDLLIERIVGPLGLRADRRSPTADARLPDGSRVNVIVPPLALDGPCITIRRFGARRIPLGALCPPGVADLLAWAVAARANLVVSGGTGAGKTTLLNSLGELLPETARVVTVEDTAELQLPGRHVVRLEARPATADGLGATTIRELVRNALRMRPDRIVVGEVRGPEVVDMLWAMNTGHEGSLTTCHANSPLDALRRLEVMALTAGLDLPLSAVRDQLASAIDLVVQVVREADGRRRVHAVGEVVDPPEQGRRIRTLAGPEGLHELPTRAPRGTGVPPPDPGWCR